MNPDSENLFVEATYDEWNIRSVVSSFAWSKRLLAEQKPRRNRFSDTTPTSEAGQGPRSKTFALPVRNGCA